MRTDQEIINCYVVTAGVTRYSVTFPLYEDSDVAVYLSTDGGATERLLTRGTEYGVERIGDPDQGGFITLTAGVAKAGDVIALVSNVPYTQELDLNGVSVIDTEATERQLDRDCQQRQQLAQMYARTVKVPQTSSKTPEQYWDGFKKDMEDSVEAAASEADRAQGIADEVLDNANYIRRYVQDIPVVKSSLEEVAAEDRDGLYWVAQEREPREGDTEYLRGVVPVKKVGDTLTIVSDGLGVLDEKSVIAEGTAVPRQLKDRFADVLNVRDFGAKGDGVTDDTAAIQRAVASRKDVFFPEGVYCISETIELQNGSALHGAGIYTPNSASNVKIPEFVRGSTIIRWIGDNTKSGANLESCMIRASNVPVGVHPGTNIDGTISADHGNKYSMLYNSAVTGITLDGNETVDFGLYIAKCGNGCTFDSVSVTQTNKHGIYISWAWCLSIHNWFAFANRGCGVTAGIDIFNWQNTAGTETPPPFDQTDMHNISCQMNGYSVANSSYMNQFSESNYTAEYGFGFKAGRSFTVCNISANDCGGAGIYAETSTQAPTEIKSGYIEFCGRSSNAQYAHHIIVKAVGGRTLRFVDFRTSNEASTSPKLARITLINGNPINPAGMANIYSPVIFDNFANVKRIASDFGTYRVINSNKDIEFIGVKPRPLGDIEGNNANCKILGTCVFTYDGSNVSVISKNGIVDSVTRNAVGEYFVNVDTTYCNPYQCAVSAMSGINTLCSFEALSTGVVKIFIRAVDTHYKTDTFKTCSVIITSNF